jgi:hypothetical protein
MPDIWHILQAMNHFFLTRERVPVGMEWTPILGVPLLCPSREDFACTYYSGTPVCSVSDHLLQLSCYMAIFSNM